KDLDITKQTTSQSARFSRRLFREMGLHQSLADTQFGVQNGASSGTPNGIVTEQSEFIVQNWATAEPANSHGHTTSCITVSQSLWPIRLPTVKECAFGRAGQLQMLWFSLIVFPGRDYFFSFYLAHQFDTGTL